ncbi:hypothetical protein DNH61_07825 [Paenibacillus sambharensis]|uniref:Hemolysin XhlA n=1 Tax=Paenibacillus sambharensis TaxID=1803190 RepID=A0A2W1LCJ9_9BACL|nr:hemolysin XhlA family protein [Paenibacillus sambharensis]PZD96409.1 hypothetical protein DNH61_07825 [Paenibacillus sambharensis]
MGGGDPMDMGQFYSTITEIRVELGKLSTRLEKLDDFTRRLEDIAKRTEVVEEVAGRAYESTKSAHQRLDQIYKIAAWFFTTAGGLVLAAVVSFALRGGFVNP